MKMYNFKMKVFIVALLFVACASAGVLNSGRTPVVTLLDYYKNSENEARIIDGESANPGQFPWQAVLIISFPGRKSLCGGSLISSNWILTAAHCVSNGFEWNVTVGGVNRNVANEEGSVSILSSNGIAHEKYDSLSLNNDIALIKLDKDVDFSDTIQPIRLPARSEVDDRLEHIKVIASGYGKTSDWGNPSETLKFVELTTITNKQCAEVYGSITIIYSTICAVGNPYHSTCNGDSGGPLVTIDEQGQATLVGVVSFVSGGGCATGTPSGYVRTAMFLDWISEKTGIEIRD